MEESSAPDGWQCLIPGRASAQPTESCDHQELNEQLFTYRDASTLDASSEASEFTIAENSTVDRSSYCGSEAGSSFSIRKLYIGKVRKQSLKARNARQLRRYRKWLMPKNAITTLNEMQGAGIAECIVNRVGQETKVELLVNNHKYEGTGRCVKEAKAKASELALRDLIFERVAHVEPSQGMENTSSDDLPVVQLASFAIHKLLDEWKKDGFEFPDTMFNMPNAAPNHQPPALRRSIKTVTDLPPDAASHHPTSLFAYMRPQTPFEDLGWNGDLLNPEFTVGLLVDGRYFTGKGRSKKLARKAAASIACNVLFGVVFYDSGVSEHSF